MPSIDPDLIDHPGDAAYWKLWDAYATVALQSVLTFHGACDDTAPSKAADHAAECATELMKRRLEAMAAIEAAHLAAREAEKATKAKPAAKR